MTNKKFLTFGILLVVLAGVFIPTHIIHAEIAGIPTSFSDIIDPLFKAIGQFLMMMSSFVLIFSGMIFDWILKFTIVDMAKNIGGSSGVGASITTAWATLRDIANMCFIFVLLFAAFKAMFDTNFGGFGKTVKDIIIVALLINFSLFFSKVVIDASNIVSVGFYNSITESNTPQLSGSKYVMGSVSNFKGISGGYMNMLGMQTLYSADILSGQTDAKNILLIGVMSSVFMLITAVILFIAAIMFAARFIILIFLMILSPLALIAYIIPGQMSNFTKWKDALIDQSFFAPIYFALTWVVFKLGTSLIDTIKDAGMEPQKGFGNMFNDPGSAVAIIINYVLIIGFAIAALVISKTMASKTAGFKQISGGIGAAALGGAALAGRNTIGRASSLVSEKYRDTLSKSTAGRAGLWLADKGKKGSFDVRATDTLKKVPGLGGELDIMGKAGGKGGFAKVVEDKVKAKAQYAKDVYGQTDQEKAEAKKRQTDYDIEKAGEEKNIKARRLVEVDRRLASARTPEETAKAEAYKEYVNKINKKNIFDDKEYSTEFKNKDIVKKYETFARAGERRQEEYAKRLEGAANKLTMAGTAVGAVVGGFVAGVQGAALGAGIGAGLGSANKAAAGKIRLESKGPSKEKKLADIISKEFTEETATPTAPEATPSATPTPPPSNSTT